jgi:hypothetical protein
MRMRDCSGCCSLPADACQNRLPMWTPISSMRIGSNRSRPNRGEHSVSDWTARRSAHAELAAALRPSFTPGRARVGSRRPPVHETPRPYDAVGESPFFSEGCDGRSRHLLHCPVTGSPRDGEGVRMVRGRCQPANRIDDGVRWMVPGRFQAPTIGPRQVSIQSTDAHSTIPREW